MILQPENGVIALRRSVINILPQVAEVYRLFALNPTVHVGFGAMAKGRRQLA
jgi:hypothetical protein